MLDIQHHVNAAMRAAIEPFVFGDVDFAPVNHAFGVRHELIAFIVYGYWFAYDLHDDVAW